VAVYFYYKPSAKSRASGDLLTAALNSKRQPNGGKGLPQQTEDTASTHKGQGEHDGGHKKDRLDGGKADNFYTECEGNNKGTSDKSYFEFFDKKMLQDFLTKRDKPYDGILQKFIEPDTVNNTVYRV
jgi:hypothetical protein